MSETYSYDNTPETEVLTAEEQDSLQVGEQLEAEHARNATEDSIGTSWAIC